ncbi:hypothetical protein BRYFOR_05757 [Marvinbryantia formatexigens DSM 14469]|uniref:Uncharacterized protein n=1 Tax=Marvinbryantia formatexigens DSM 14469 TaxID=478749 RepID=C6LAW3_9FIRM|nr:hypothetical protein BRYFOR_05757 [Marvinbryantia formatexigens DSM 14469]
MNAVNNNLLYSIAQILHFRTLFFWRLSCILNALLLFTPFTATRIIAA